MRSLNWHKSAGLAICLWILSSVDAFEIHNKYEFYHPLTLEAPAFDTPAAMQRHREDKLSSRKVKMGRLFRSRKYRVPN